MKLTVKRHPSSKESTIGELYVDGQFQCYTLEDITREGKKVAGTTAIPKGTYKVLITMSPKYKKLLPLIVDVPGFDGVRIHSGNVSKDTEGCILVGTSMGVDVINNSRVAFEALFEKLKTAKDISIEIS